MSIYTPYTYLIGWSKHNIWYYGKRTKIGCHPSELFNIKLPKSRQYATSSKYVKDFIASNGLPDIIQIRKTFNNADSCSIWETRVLNKLKAATNPKFLNKCNGNWQIDYSDPIIKRKLSQANKGKTRTAETKTKLSVNRYNRLYEFIDPNGVVYSHHSIPKFAKEHQLNQVVLYKNLGQGKIQPGQKCKNKITTQILNTYNWQINQL